MNDLQVRGDVYAADMQKSLRTLAELTKKDVNQLVKDRAPTMARYLASWTMPVANFGKNAEGNPDGESLAARNLGQSAVSRDIGRVYLGPEKLKSFLKGKRTPKEKGGVSISSLFTRFVSEGRLDRAQKIIRTQAEFASVDVIPWDGGKWHKSNRYTGGSYGGRVRKNARQKIVADSQKLREYVRQKREQVGFTKSAWITAGRMAGGKNGLRAKWITKHNAPAHGAFKMIGAIGEAVLSSRVPWIDKKLNETGAMEAFDRSFRKEIDTATRKILEREQRKK
jgi:hypothetical protein